MKHITCLLFAMLSLATANAQVAQWLVPPEYDDLKLLSNSSILLARQGGDSYIWSTDGKRLDQLTEHLHPFSDGYAVSTQPKTGKIGAFYNVKGEKKIVAKYNVMPGWDHTAFHDGFLLVNDGMYFYFMNSKGVIDNTPYHVAFPFNNGYAMCINYEKPQKLKNPRYQLLDTNLKPIALRWQGKMLPTDDIEFISSVNDSGIAIVEAKGKLFFFSAENGELTPIMGSPRDNNMKNHARLSGSLKDNLTSVGDTMQVLTARSGKHGSVVIAFDKMLRPVTISYSGDIHIFNKKEAPFHQLRTMLTTVTDSSHKVGLYSDGEVMLPPQFDSISLCLFDKAIVVKDSKYGLLQIHRHDKIRIRLNKGEPIGFRHRRFDTDIRIDLPSYVSPASTSIEIVEASGCHVDNIPYETKETNFGNYALYRCELYMPDSLTDEATDITYPTRVIYSSLRSPDIVIKNTAWHMKYFNVDISENDYSITDGTLSFTFNVSADRQSGESIYPHKAFIIADSLQAEITDRISETRYKCKIHNLHEGVNTFTIQIIEKGCPPADFTFEVNYISRPARGEKKVTMKKKQNPTPRLRI